MLHKGFVGCELVHVKMKKYTANYAYVNANFVVQNSPQPVLLSDQRYHAVLYILRNLLLRGTFAQLSGDHKGKPTRLSQYLQGEIGLLQEDADFRTYFWLVGTQSPIWHQTIKGDPVRGYVPAREFYDALPELLGAWGFVQQLILPEALITDIVSATVDMSRFVHQRVDFYCPPAKLIIEIDGGQHQGLTKVGDDARDQFFADLGIQTIRIQTRDWREQTGTLHQQIEAIKDWLSQKANSLKGYKEQHERMLSNGLSDDELRTKLLPTSVLRFQVLLIELLMSGHLRLDDSEWRFCVTDADRLSDQFPEYSRFPALALSDLFIWLKNLCDLHKLSFKQPEVPLARATCEARFEPGAINVNFSLLRRYTDENNLQPDVLFVRTDYFAASQEIDGKNYFLVAMAAPVDYKLTNDPKTIETLRFFPKELFDKDDFREGQLPIILNALNRKDTIGLLPTGGGKSLCYQLPCLLQPAISFIVCPIKSLMYDQKANLDAQTITQTNYVTGELAPAVKDEIQRDFANGQYLFVWLSPERFQTTAFRQYLGDLQTHGHSVAYAVIDEAHCLSEWGHEFRTSYLNLAKTIQRYCPTATCLALTATASVNVLRDIRLEFARNGTPVPDEDVKTKLDFSRPELEFEIIQTNDKSDTLTKQLRTLQKDGRFLTPATRHTVAGLVFTPHTNGTYGCYNTSATLNQQYPNQANWYAGESPNRNLYIQMPDADFNDRTAFAACVQGQTKDTLNEFDISRLFANRENLRVTTYVKAGHQKIQLRKVPVLSKTDFEQHKQAVQRDYKADKFPLMVATKAFGMGIDKSNIQYTFHYGLPGSAESLYQEAGRAGRWNVQLPENKGKKAICRVLFTDEDMEAALLDELFTQGTPLNRINEIIALPDQRDSLYHAGDVTRQLFLFAQGKGSIDEEAKVINALLEKAFVVRNTPVVNVLWRNPSASFQDAGLAGVRLPYKQETIERAIYRLSLLGVVQDWTTDFTCHFRVEFKVLPETTIRNALVQHLIKYNKDDASDSRNLIQQIGQSPGTTSFSQCIGYLLNWTWRTIAYSRRESLKNLRSYCLNFTDSRSFKQTLDNIFRINDFTFVIQYIADNPKLFDQWEKAFVDKTGMLVLDRAEFTVRRDNLTRFLESSPENLGLDTIIGLLRLALDDFDDTDGRARLEKTLSRMPDYFIKPDEQQAVLRTIVGIVRRLNLPVENRYQLAESIGRFYTEDWISDELDLLNLRRLTDLSERLQILNHKIHDGLSKIG